MARGFVYIFNGFGMDRIRKVFKKIRRGYGFSQVDISGGGISESAVSRFERGRDVRLSTFVKMVDNMGCSLVIVDNEAFKKEEGD